MTTVVNTLPGYKGDLNLLLEPEKFLMQLIAVPNYALRVHVMLLREQLLIDLPQIRESISLLITAIQGIDSVMTSSQQLLNTL